MMQRLHSFLEQVSTWSRAMQWGFWAAVVTVAFLVWDVTVADLNATWSAEVSRLEQQTKEVKQPVRLTSTVKTAVSAFGELELPRTEEHGASSMTQAVHEILSNHNVKNDEYTRTKSTTMKSSSLPGIARAGEHIKQVIGDIRFESTQEEILQVIAALEDSPWIDAIANVRLTKKDGRMIQVDLSVEAWVVATTQKRGRR